jgi:hypothetical protein
MDRQMYGWTDRWMYLGTYREAHGWIDGNTDRFTDREIDSQTDGEIDGCIY